MQARTRTSTPVLQASINAIELLAAQGYNISKQLVRNPAHAALVPHVQEMSTESQTGRASARPKRKRAGR